jgi:DNA-binding XRE family transcriptional regulator
MIKRSKSSDLHKQEQKGSVGRAKNRGAYLHGLHACRLMAALTQRELAEKIGTHQSTICDLENLKRGGYPTTVRRLCKVLEVEPAKLLYGEAYKDLT